MPSTGCLRSVQFDVGNLLNHPYVALPAALAMAAPTPSAIRSPSEARRRDCGWPGNREMRFFIPQDAMGVRRAAGQPDSWRRAGRRRRPRRLGPEAKSLSMESGRPVSIVTIRVILLCRDWRRIRAEMSSGNLLVPAHGPSPGRIMEWGSPAPETRPASLRRRLCGRRTGFGERRRHGPDGTSPAGQRGGSRRNDRIGDRPQIAPRPRPARRFGGAGARPLSLRQFVRVVGQRHPAFLRRGARFRAIPWTDFFGGCRFGALGDRTCAVGRHRPGHDPGRIQPSPGPFKLPSLGGGPRRLRNWRSIAPAEGLIGDHPRTYHWLQVVLRRRRRQAVEDVREITWGLQ